MKIAFVVSFFDFRNDVRRVIAEVAARHEVVVLGKPQDTDTIGAHLPEGVEFRTIQEQKPNVWNKFWERAYLFFRKIPQSRTNFFLMEHFKASYSADAHTRDKALRIFRWIRRLPKFLSYDAYLNRLDYLAGTPLDDIDLFICFTAIADDYLLARLIHENRRVRVYVYSWDHPYKHTCFSKRAHYACWSEPIREDVISLQNIPADRMSVTGASQFCYIRQYREHDFFSAQYPFRYVYFGCAIGIADLVPDEIRLIKILAETLKKVQPDWKLLVRPYPVLPDWTLYEQLRKLPNVIFDEDFRQGDLSVQEQKVMEKYATIEQAEAFFHLGTTMGLEACFTDTPSFVLDFGYATRAEVSLYNFVHQYQNDRHLINLAPQNAILSQEKLQEILADLDNPEYHELNQLVQRNYELKTFAEFADAIATKEVW